MKHSFKKPEPDEIKIPSTNTEKIPLGSDGYSATEINGRRVHNIVAAIHNRMAEGLAPVVLITGESQTGKSWTALRIAYELYEITEACNGSFEQKNILYDPVDALNAMTANFNEKEELPAIKQILIADELGEQANAYKHNTIENRAYKMILNVLPVLKNCFIGLDPQSERIDKKIRDKPHYRLWMTDVGVAKATGRRYIKTDKKGKDVYSTDYFSTWNVEKPPKSYREKFRPKELDYKLDQPIKYLKKLSKKGEDKTDFTDF
ncbi:MAG: hypothetical protein ACOCTT_01005 [archaeon]